MGIYDAALNQVAWPLWEKWRGRRSGEIDEFLAQSQWWSLEELRALQDRGVERLVAHCALNVPFYRERFEQAGVSPAEVKSVGDLDSLPVVRRHELRNAGASWKAENLPPPTIIKETSGSSGVPLRFGYDSASEAFRRSVTRRAYGWAGERLGVPALHFWGVDAGYPSLRGALRSRADNLIRRRKYLSCAVLDERTLSMAVDIVARMRPKVLVCYALAGAALARYVLERGCRDWPDITVITGAEPLLKADRASLECAFGPVFETYGCRETMLLASECECHSGLHVPMENVIVEVLVCNPGQLPRPAAPGEQGEVVVTDLNNLTMPFVRYAVGDLAVAGASERCQCGRGAAKIEAIVGRTTETIRNGAGDPVNTVAFDFLFDELAANVEAFQVTQKRGGDVVLRIAQRVDAPLSRRHLDQIEAGLKQLVTGVPVRLELTDKILRTGAGKHRLIVVEK